MTINVNPPAAIDPAYNHRINGLVDPAAPTETKPTPLPQAEAPRTPTPSPPTAPSSAGRIRAGESDLNERANDGERAYAQAAATAPANREIGSGTYLAQISVLLLRYSISKFDVIALNSPITPSAAVTMR